MGVDRRVVMATFWLQGSPDVNWQLNGLGGGLRGRGTNLRDKSAWQRLRLGVTFRSVVPRGPIVTGASRPRRIRLCQNARRRGATYLPELGVPAARRCLQCVIGPPLRLFG
jgi:hypothetical protein